MPQPGRHFFASARGRLLFFNLLVVAVTLMVSGVAVLGFQHASQIQEQVQQQTVDDMTGSMNLARDTANVATAAVRLSQVVGALEYKGKRSGCRRRKGAEAVTGTTGYRAAGTAGAGAGRANYPAQPGVTKQRRRYVAARSAAAPGT